MCLWQSEHRSERNKESGRLCVANQTFLAVESVKGDFPANGIVGLAPSDDSRSFVWNLKQQGVIEKELVSINFEDPLDKSQQSAISFGEIDGSQIVNGEQGLTYFSNTGYQQWALLVDHIKYNEVKVINDNNNRVVVYTKIAIIDSGNNSIQIPESEFRTVQSKMISQESSL
jgi:hypothetical protein